MADEDVIDRPRSAFEGYPSLVREELERRERQRSAAGDPAAPVDGEVLPPAPSPGPAPPSPKVVPLHGPPVVMDAELEDAETIRQQLAKKSDPKPESPQEPYRAHASFLNRLKTQERTFYCVFRDCTYRGFAYAHYDGIRLEKSARPGGGLDIVVRFHGSEIEDIRLEGGPLRFVADCIGLGIMPWVWELPDGQTPAEGATVITRITVTKIERK
jgi:hypothetical protein